jgi:tetratricopeptide (TPR) repeat protein
LIVEPAPGKDTVGSQKACREQPPAQSSLQEATDANRPYDERRGAYENVLQLCPDDVSIYAPFAALLLEHNEGESALAWLRRGLEIAPGNPSLAASEGVALLAIGKPDEAAAVLEKVPREGRNAFYLGLAYRALRKHKEAQRALRQAFETGFEDPYVLYVLIEQDRAAGDKEVGLSDFRTFYERFPNSPWLHMLYGDAYMARNDDLNAEPEYEQVLKLAPDLPTVNFHLGYIAFRRADYPAAERHFRKEIESGSNLPEAHFYLGTALRRLGKNSEALPFLEQAVIRDPNYILAYNELAAAQKEAGRIEDAIHTMSAGEQRFPEEAAFPAQLASLLKRLGRTEEAAKEAEKATTLSQRNNPILRGGAGSAGIVPSVHANQSSPASTHQSPPSVSQAGDTGHVVKSGSAGKSPAAPARDSLDSSLEPLNRCVMRSDSNCATQALAKIHGSIKDSPEYLALEAQTFSLQRRKEEALAAINHAIEIAPKNYRFLMIQGQIYQSFNDQPSAIQSFLQAAQLQPHSSEAFYFLGMSFFFLEDHPRAERHFQTAITLDVRNHRAIFMMAVTKMVAFKLPEAKGYFEQALSLQPGNPFYHLHFGILRARMGDRAAAIRQVRTAERLDPSYALTHYNLGHLYEETGDYLAARGELEKATQIQPSLAEPFYQLGLVYRHLGMMEDSQRAYERFQKLMAEQKQSVLDPVESTLVMGDPGLQPGAGEKGAGTLDPQPGSQSAPQIPQSSHHDVN